MASQHLFIKKSVLRSACAAPLILGALTVYSPTCLARSSLKNPAKIMFQTRIQGPYALSVRDGLNEMLIKTQLIHHGVQAVTDPNVGLAAVMGSLPSILPTDGYVSSGFGYRLSPFNGRRLHHNGIDFAVNYGTPVRATADGTVTSAGRHRFLGNLVTVDHGFGITTRYGHNSKVLVQIGDHVRRGDIIAKAGSTGHSTGPHLHYEVWLNHRRTDPSRFMFEIPSDSKMSTTLVSKKTLPANIAKNKTAQLGLAMGGEDEDTEAFIRARALMPTFAERLPVNLATVLALLLASLVLISSQVPKVAYAKKYARRRSQSSTRSTAL
ncbi:MAG: M23 family metallopeptidase [Proteobacteria bacterium]|nr:M23 family metallopeptidase [Pseudomonadota bacterium]